MARADVKDGIMRRTAASALDGTELRVAFILRSAVGFKLCLCWLWLEAGA